MASGKLDIYVFADWIGLGGAKPIGILSAHFAKGKKAFSFAYDNGWLRSGQNILLDPDIDLFAGPQYPSTQTNFGIFLDSMPDTWGRTLMKRREVEKAKREKVRSKKLYDIDFLLGVFDASRMGALRFKTERDGDFLDNNKDNPTPPWSSLGALQEAVNQMENQNHKSSEWLTLLLAPGSSLGGARPKANVLDTSGDLWIAKFPSKQDIVNKAAWEFLAYQLALDAKINMSISKLDKINGRHHTFLTKRFDRVNGKRIHFASAMTMTGNTEESIKDYTPSYLELVECIERFGVDVKNNLHQLWRRIVFNMAISNTDDHLRNHGFLLKNNGWILSPAFDLNPSVDKKGLSLNIDMDDNALDIELAKNVGAYFRLSSSEMEVIIDEVLGAVRKWRSIAKRIGIPRGEQELMESAFMV